MEGKDRNALTLTGLLMEGLDREVRYLDTLSP
jgi:hypothetical protein